MIHKLLRNNAQAYGGFTDLFIRRPVIAIVVNLIIDLLSAALNPKVRLS